MGKEQSRILYLDALRLIATFAVIAIHVTATGYTKTVNVMEAGGYSSVSELWGGVIYLIINKLTHIGVPLFIMISGALFLRPEKNIQIKSVYSKLIPRLAIPYFFWWAFYVLVWIAVLKLSPQLIRIQDNSIERYLPPVHLWYLPMLMGIYVVSPLLKLIAGDRKDLRYFLVLWFIFVILSSISSLRGVYEAFRMHFVIGYTGYFMLGYYLSTIEFSYKKRKQIYIVSILSALLYVIQSFSVNIWHCMDTDIIDCYPILVLLSISLFVWCKYHDWTKWGPLLSNIYPYLFGVYLIHTLFVLLVTREPIYTMINPIFNIPLLVVAVFIISLGCTYVIKKIPFLQKVVE